MKRTIKLNEVQIGNAVRMVIKEFLKEAAINFNQYEVHKKLLEYIVKIYNYLNEGYDYNNRQVKNVNYINQASQIASEANKYAYQYYGLTKFSEYPYSNVVQMIKDRDYRTAMDRLVNAYGKCKKWVDYFAQEYGAGQQQQQPNASNKNDAYNSVNRGDYRNVDPNTAYSMWKTGKITQREYLSICQARGVQPKY